MRQRAFGDFHSATEMMSQPLQTSTLFGASTRASPLYEGSSRLRKKPRPDHPEVAQVLVKLASR